MHTQYVHQIVNYTALDDFLSMWWSFYSIGCGQTIHAKALQPTSASGCFELTPNHRIKAEATRGTT